VVIGYSNGNKKRDGQQARATELKGLRTSVAVASKASMARTTVSQPSPQTPAMNVTIGPPLNKKGNKKRQGSSQALGELTTADVAAKLLTQTDASGSNALANAFSENGIGISSLSSIL